jgi:hypothetical protein
VIFKTLTGKVALGRGGERACQLPPGTARYRDILLVVLTLTTGALDAVTFSGWARSSAVSSRATWRCSAWPPAWSGPPGCQGRGNSCKIC